MEKSITEQALEVVIKAEISNQLSNFGRRITEFLKDAKGNDAEKKEFEIKTLETMKAGFEEYYVKIKERIEKRWK